MTETKRSLNYGQEIAENEACELAITSIFVGALRNLDDIRARRLNQINESNLSEDEEEKVLIDLWERIKDSVRTAAIQVFVEHEVFCNEEYAVKAADRIRKALDSLPNT